MNDETLTDEAEADGEAPKPPKTFDVTVNDDAVVLTGHDQTGASVKAAAVAAGVPIQPDFALSIVKPKGKQKPVGDDEQIEVKDGEAFWAIPGDDNS